jgi:hypothetical protein
MRYSHDLSRVQASFFRMSVIVLVSGCRAFCQAPVGGPAACPNLNAAAPELSRIAAVLNVCTQALNAINAKASPALQGFKIQMDSAQTGLIGSLSELNQTQPAQTERHQENADHLKLQEQLALIQNNSDLTAVSAAATRATLEINRMLLVMERNRSKNLTAQMTAEQKAYRRTKILNAFLGTSIGVVGSGMQFSSSTAVQHAGDGVSVAGGAATILFAVCTADIDVVDSEPTYAPTQGQVHDYLQMTNPELLAPGEKPTPAQNHGKLSCHAKGAPHQQTGTVAAQEEREEKLTGALLNMNNEISQLLARVQ